MRTQDCWTKMTAKKRTLFRVRIARYQACVQFGRLLSGTYTFGIVNEVDQTTFDNPVDAHDAIARCPALVNFDPIIESIQEGA